METNPPSRLRSRVFHAAEKALETHGYVSPIDVLTGIGWLDNATVSRWRLGQLSFLEHGIENDRARLNEVLELLRAWAQEKHLSPSESAYVAKSPAAEALQFTAEAEAEVERQYRTHWSPR